ncbi:zinc finger BED domain-containing protein 6-like [Aphis gossypii]|uniref:zinc finger BED domain-containing protein 6-like n=1 Tax=Aphis gossypii TaxID=80765 RepID=UPI002158BF46|nr:zinc finger BED domain-containing protein 6-like [Aphis gossypii]
MPKYSKKRSHIWNHFTIIDEQYAKFSYCSAKVSYGGGSSSNLTRHIKTKHITVPLDQGMRKQVQNLVIEENVDDPSSSGTTGTTIFNQPSTSSQLTSSEPEPAQTSIRPLQLVPKPTQTSINSFIQKPITISKSKKIDSQISKLIIKHYHPFSLVEEKEFKNLIHLLAPGYTLPSRKTIANSLIPQLYESTVTEIKHKLKNIQAICLTTDAWTLG